MSFISQVREEVERFDCGEVILAGELHRERLHSMPETAYYKALGRLVQDGCLMRVSKGLYCRVESFDYAFVCLDERKVIERYVGKGGSQGVVIGAALFRSKMLTSRVAALIEILSSVADTKRRMVGSVRVEKAPLPNIGEYREAVETMEILANYGKVDSLDVRAFYDYVLGIPQRFDATLFKELIDCGRYRKVSIAFLAAILDGSGTSHSLDRYYSKLSTFKYPSMEQLAAEAAAYVAVARGQAVLVRPDKELERGRPRNYCEVMRKIELGSTPQEASGDFLDEFYHAPAYQRQGFLAAEPPELKARGVDAVFYARCAAVAESLAESCGIERPAWVEKEQYFLDAPYVGGTAAESLPPRLVEAMRAQSPNAFKRRNLYVTANALERY